MPEVGAPQINHDDIVAVLRRQQARTDLSDEDLSVFADAQLRTKGSAARAAMASCSSSAQLVVARSKVLQVKTTVSVVLTAGEKKIVRTTYPERDFVFNDVERHDHGLAATMRKIDRSILREKLPLRARVVDIGGDYVYNMLESGAVIHSCCPNVDPKDKFREVERSTRLRRVAANTSYTADVRDRAARFARDADFKAQWMCRDRVQDCQVPADVLLMSHVYDMRIEDVAQALISHGARNVFGCLILAPEMLENRSGELPSVNGWYQLDEENDRMTYGTKGGGSWHYHHKWSELRRYTHDCVVYCGDAAVAYRVSETRGQTIFFELWRLENSAPLVNQPRRAYSVAGGPWAVVRGYQFVGARGQFATAKPLPVIFRYPWDTWNRAMEYARGQIANKRFTLEDFARKMRTMTAKITVNSVAVAGVDAISEEKFADFLANCALAAMYAVEKEKIEVQSLLDSVTKRRTEASAWERALRGFVALVTMPITASAGWFSVLRQRCRAAALESLHTVTYDRDDGTRTVNVDQFPRGALAIQSSRSQTLEGSPSSDDIHDLIFAACARDSDYAEQMRNVLAMSEAAVGNEDDEDQIRFVEGLRAVVSSGSRATTTTDAAVVVERADNVVANLEFTASDDSMLAHAEDQTALKFDEAKARERCEYLGVDDLLPSDEVKVFDVDAIAANRYYKAAMAEAIRLYNAEERRATGECINSYMKTTSGGRPNKHLLDLLQGDALKPDYYDVVDGQITSMSYRGVPVSLFSHSAVFLPTKQMIHRVKNVDGVVTVVANSTYTGLALVISTLEIFNGPEIRDAIAAAIPRFDIRNFVIVIRDGVPGCGKTTQIIRGARYDDLILASGKENTQATREKKIGIDREAVEAARKAGTMFTPFQNPTKRIRTYDSYLMSRVYEKAAVLHADECFMEHSGKLMAAVVLSGARRVEFHGDTQQVPYVNRHVEEMCLFPTLAYRHLHINRYISHRCPQDAIAAIAARYDYKIRTTSNVVNSLSLSTDVPLDAVTWERGKKYLTLYQDDKAAVAKKCHKGGVSTVGESQGETYTDVVFVRQQARSQDLYNKWPYVLVGLSRHTKSCQYLAPSSTSSLFERQMLSVIADEEYCRQFGDVPTAGKPTNVRL